MSAIFGICDLKGRPIDQLWIESMKSDLSHRGPDNQGLYQEESLVLGNMLLHVTPESLYDKSPYEENGFVITAHARLDEREACMDRLNIDPTERDKITDPQLLLRSFIKFGKDFLNDIYGDFAFAIWDRERKELFCGRDQVGIKPFLYYYHDNRFVFSTEIKAIVKLPFVQTEIDLSSIRDITLGFPNHPGRTTWKSIFRLNPACTISFQNTEIQISTYWKRINKVNPLYKSEAQTAKALRELLEKVISDHTRVIGEVGVPLSGGLDSSTIACLAARIAAKQNKRITTASSVLAPGYADPTVKDEMEFIQEVLRQEDNIDPYFVYHSDLSLLDHLNEKHDRNYTYIVRSHYLDEALNKKFQFKSIRRVLSGTLGDMTTSNSTVDPLSHLLVRGRFWAFFKLCYKLKRNHQLSLISQLLPLLPPYLLKIYYRLRKLKLPWIIGDLPLVLSNSEKAQLQQDTIALYKKFCTFKKDHTQDIWPSNIDSFGEEWDCSPSHLNLELTYPLQDRRILEFLFQIPVEHFQSKGLKRGLIRNSMIGILPEKIRLRRDKKAYSPDYFKITTKGISKLKLLLDDEKSSKVFSKIIDVTKLKSQIGKLEVSGEYSEVEDVYYDVVDLCMAIVFIHWFINKDNPS